MIHVVVTVLAVATNAVEVGDGGEELADGGHLAVTAEISRIGLGHLDSHGIQHIGTVDNSDLFQFGFGHINEIGI